MPVDECDFFLIDLDHVVHVGNEVVDGGPTLCEDVGFRDTSGPSMSTPAPTVSRSF